MGLGKNLVDELLKTLNDWDFLFVDSKGISRGLTMGWKRRAFRPLNYAYLWNDPDYVDNKMKYKEKYIKEKRKCNETQLLLMNNIIM